MEWWGKGVAKAAEVAKVAGGIGSVGGPTECVLPFSP